MIWRIYSLKILQQSSMFLPLQILELYKLVMYCAFKVVTARLFLRSSIKHLDLRFYHCKSLKFWIALLEDNFVGLCVALILGLFHHGNCSLLPVARVPLKFHSSCLTILWATLSLEPLIFSPGLFTSWFWHLMYIFIFCLSGVSFHSCEVMLYIWNLFVSMWLHMQKDSFDRCANFLWLNSKFLLQNIAGVHFNIDIPRWLHILHLDRTNLYAGKELQYCDFLART